MTDITSFLLDLLGKEIQKDPGPPPKEVQKALKTLENLLENQKPIKTFQRTTQIAYIEVSLFVIKTNSKTFYIVTWEYDAGMADYNYSYRVFDSLKQAEACFNEWVEDAKKLA